jgi:hypothetical protein
VAVSRADRKTFIGNVDWCASSFGRAVVFEAPLGLRALSTPSIYERCIKGRPLSVIGDVVECASDSDQQGIVHQIIPEWPAIPRIFDLIDEFRATYSSI